MNNDRSMTVSAYGYLFPVLIAFTVVYYNTLSWLLGTWPTYRGSHGPIILAVSIYMIWTKKEEIGRLSVRPNLVCGAALTAFGCLLLVAGRFGSLMLLQYFSLVVTLMGLVWLLWGTAYMKFLWYPIAYIVFMFPVFSEISGGISIHLQNAAATIALPIIKLLGIAAYRHGTFIELPTITLEVARECNGINHIVALVSLAVPLAYWTQETPLKKAALVASAFPIGVLANGIRIAIIGIVAVYYPGSPTHGPYSLFYVSFIFFFGMIAMLGISKAMGRKGKANKDENKQIVSSSDSREPKTNNMYPVICALMVFSLTGAYLFLFKPIPVDLVRPIANFPYSVWDWKGRDVTFKEYPFSQFLADMELKRTYKDSHGHELNIYIGYIPVQDQERKIVGIHFDTLQWDAITVSIDTGKTSMNIRQTESHDALGKRIIYFWYDMDGEIVTDRYSAKVKTILGAFMKRRTNAAIVVVSTTNENNNDFSLGVIRELIPIIQNSLKTRET